MISLVCSRLLYASFPVCYMYLSHRILFCMPLASYAGRQVSDINIAIRRHLNATSPSTANAADSKLTIKLPPLERVRIGGKFASATDVEFNTLGRIEDRLVDGRPPPHTATPYLFIDPPSISCRSMADRGSHSTHPGAASPAYCYPGRQLSPAPLARRTPLPKLYSIWRR